MQCTKLFIAGLFFVKISLLYSYAVDNPCELYKYFHELGKNYRF